MASLVCRQDLPGDARFLIQGLIPVTGLMARDKSSKQDRSCPAKGDQEENCGLCQLKGLWEDARRQRKASAKAVRRKKKKKASPLDKRALVRLDRV